MEVKKMNVLVDTTVAVTTATTMITTTMTNPTAVITQIASKEHLKILELTEYCKIAQSTVKECESKVQMLVSSKNETARLKMEFLTRDKINVTNYESLLQAKNELSQYKCELKSNYVAVEKAVKTKKFHYEKIISSYEADWQKTLEEYTANPLVKELNDIQRTNDRVESNTEIQKKLAAATKNEFLNLQQNVKEKYLNKIIEFSRAMIEYQKFLTSQKSTGEKNGTEYSQKSQKRAEMNFSKSLVPAISKAMAMSREDTGYFSGVDVSVFDELMVPSENLEIQDEEEELFHFIQGQQMQINDNDNDDADQEESAEMFLNDYPQSDELDKGETQTNAESSEKQTGKATKEENESQYFKNQPPECMKQYIVQNTSVENWDPVSHNFNESSNKEFNDTLHPSAGVLKGNNEKTYCEDNVKISKQIESEKSVSEASYDNQNVYLRENFEYTYNKTHSLSSEEMPFSAENTIESFGSPQKVMNFEQPNIFKLQDDPEKEDSKSFGDFFAVSSDKNSSRPSIFKLF